MTSWYAGNSHPFLLSESTYVNAEEGMHLGRDDRLLYEKLFDSQVISYENLKLGDCIGQGYFVFLLLNLNQLDVCFRDIWDGFEGIRDQRRFKTRSGSEDTKKYVK